MKAIKLETVTWHLILDACPNHIKVQIPSLESQARAALSMMRLKQSNVGQHTVKGRTIIMNNNQKGREGLNRRKTPQNKQMYWSAHRRSKPASFQSRSIRRSICSVSMSCRKSKGNASQLDALATLCPNSLTQH